MYWKPSKPLAIGLLGALFSVSSVRAQTDTLFLTVDRLWECGVQNSLILQADALKEQAAAERLKTARSAQYPDLQIGLRGGFVGQPLVFRQGLTDLVQPDAPDWSQNYALDFAQPLYQGGKIRGGIRKSRLEQSIASLQTQTDEADVKLTLLRQYMNLFGLYRTHDILARDIVESERRLHDIRQMKQEGLITNNDVLRSEMQLTNDRLALSEAENSIILVSQQLNILLGQDENLLLLPDTALLYRAVAIEPYEDYVAEAFARNPSMKQLRKHTELAQNDVSLARSVSLPQVSLYASNTLARPVSRTLEDMYNNNWNVGLAVPVPLSSFYKNHHRVKESKLAVTLRHNEEEQQKQAIRVDVRTAYLHHWEALRRVEALKLSVRQAQENYRIMQNRYLSRLVILTDLLDANSVRLNVELELTTARTRVIYTYYQLQKACGRL